MASHHIRSLNPISIPTPHLILLSLSTLSPHPPINNYISPSQGHPCVTLSPFLYKQPLWIWICSLVITDLISNSTCKSIHAILSLWTWLPHLGVFSIFIHLLSNIMISFFPEELSNTLLYKCRIFSISIHRRMSMLVCFWL